MRHRRNHRGRVCRPGLQLHRQETESSRRKRRIIDKAFSQETLDRIKELTKKFFPDSSIFADDCRDSGIRRVLLFTNSPHALPGVGAKFRNTLGSVLGNLTDHLHVEILP